MHFARPLFAVLALVVAASTAVAAPVREEHVTGGVLDLVWHPGIGITNTMQPATLAPGHPAYNNPSGDHTVAVATNSMAPDSGGVILTATEPAGLTDYVWEGWIFTGDGNTRRGLVVRADPSNQFQTCYQFVVQSGLFQFNFRKLVNSAPTTLATWFATALPGGVPAPNTWHHMKVEAIGTSFRCWFDGYEFTAGTPIVDTSIASGYVGCYNFRFDLGGVPVYFDDLTLWAAGATPARKVTLGTLKQTYR
jgi:hypothetical protein